MESSASGPVVRLLGASHLPQWFSWAQAVSRLGGAQQGIAFRSGQEGANIGAVCYPEPASRPAWQRATIMRALASLYVLVYVLVTEVL
jgi:hypothetical protein